MVNKETWRVGARTESEELGEGCLASRTSDGRRGNTTRFSDGFTDGR